MRLNSRTAALTLAISVAGGLPIAADNHEAADVSAIVARHIEAKGGQDAWDAIDSLKYTGEFTAFSIPNPFTMVKTKDRKYHMDHMWGKKKVVMGTDGDAPWWDNHFFGKGAQELSGPDLAVFEREIDFATPFFDIEERGHKVKLLETTELEGQAVVALELERSDGSQETWYLDAETHLEFARDSPASDFGRPMTQRTFFEDFREVSGAMVPHFTETQWYTRDRVMVASKVEANVKPDQKMFSMPAPFGMEKLQKLAGNWKVAVESRQSPSQPWSPSEREATIEKLLAGGMFRESYTTRGIDVLRTLSFDQYRERYLVTAINSNSNTMDLLAGTWNEGGALELSNVETDTPTLQFGLTIHEKMRFLDLEKDSFRIERESSIDGGENWALTQKLTYTRKTESEDESD